MIQSTNTNISEVNNIRTNEDLPARSIAITSAAMAIPMFFMVWIIFLFLPAFLSLIIIFTAGFLFAAVAGYMAGIVGSSNNPLSGVTPIVVILTATTFALLNSLVYGGENTAELQVAVIGVAAFVAQQVLFREIIYKIWKLIHSRQLFGVNNRQVVGVTAGAVAILRFEFVSIKFLMEIWKRLGLLMASITNGILGGGMDWSMVFVVLGLLPYCSQTPGELC